MKGRLLARLALLLMAILLVACERLPREAETTLFANFEPDEVPRLISVKQVEVLPEDEAMGAEEVWCANVAHVCWSCDYAQFITCSSAWLIRRVGDRWVAHGVALEEDWDRWEAQGCPIEDPVVSMNAPGAER
jgi:hypothetical protein